MEGGGPGRPFTHPAARGWHPKPALKIMVVPLHLPVRALKAHPPMCGSPQLWQLPAAALRVRLYKTQSICPQHGICISRNLTGVFILSLSKSGNDQLPINDLEHRWPISIIIAIGID
jgi:hypothetical protein